MPVLESNGTSMTTVQYLFDHTGTSSVQMGGVYESNGTSSNPVYLYAAPYTLFKNGDPTNIFSYATTVFNENTLAPMNPTGFGGVSLSNGYISFSTSQTTDSTRGIIGPNVTLDAYTLLQANYRNTYPNLGTPYIRFLVGVTNSAGTSLLASNRHNGIDGEVDFSIKVDLTGLKGQGRPFLMVHSFVPETMATYVACVLQSVVFS